VPPGAARTLLTTPLAVACSRACIQQMNGMKYEDSITNTGTSITILCYELERRLKAKEKRRELSKAAVESRLGHK